jgi:hypothetical protein
MPIKRLVLVCSLPILVTGCAEFYGSQPPAPVYGGQPRVQPNIYAKPAPKPKPPKKAKQTKRPAAPTVETQPLKDSGPITTTPMEPIETIPMETAPGAGAIPGSAVPSVQAPAAPLPEPTEMMQPLEPVAFVSSSPAVVALVSAADQNSQSGSLDSAVAAIERAIRIEPRNAALFYKLAELRLKQSKPRLAEDLAKKSALLASGNARLKRQSWLLIGNAKVMQQDFAGARAARAKAASF